SDSDSDSTGGSEGVCGDGIVDPGEACDDGDLDDHDACLSTCEVAVCGDGVVQLGVEACDDGNAVDDDQCSSTCVRATCGDGIRNGDESGVDCGGKCSACALGEACDDGLDCVTGSCAAGLCVSARHCADVLELGVGDSDGVYVIDGDGPEGPQPPLEVYCEMSLEGGGWTAIYNRGDAVASFAEAAAFEASLATLADAEVVYPWSESQAVHSGGLDLSLYHEALFAWEPVDTLDPTRYAILGRDEGLAGLCVVDGPCPGATSLGVVDVFPSGDVVEVFTGDPQHWPQVGLGLGVGDQTIVWGYDRDGSATSNWANWYLEGPAGVAGNTPEIAAASWRYAIYIR
ncbi:MAG: hypothetical protein KC486_29575, partial [Myxococcales bacterium]|nr:hypothetical protein [Myxococcales bacterium]